MRSRRAPSGKILRRAPARGERGERLRRLPGRARRRRRDRITLDVPGKLNRVSMLARDQLAAVFAELDRTRRSASSSSPARVARSPRAATSPASWRSRPGSSRSWRATWPRPSGARSRSWPGSQGYVFGVGLELALACDFRIAADDVQLALPEATIGMIPGSGGTQRLARMIGVGRAKDMIMRGRRVGGEEALAPSASSARSCRPRSSTPRSTSLLDELRRYSPLALAMAKRVINTAYDGPLHAGLELEGLAYGLLRQTHDFREGVEAFVEKRPARLHRLVARLPRPPTPAPRPARSRREERPAGGRRSPAPPSRPG